MARDKDYIEDFVYVTETEIAKRSIEVVQSNKTLEDRRNDSKLQELRHLKLFYKPLSDPDFIEGIDKYKLSKVIDRINEFL